MADEIHLLDATAQAGLVASREITPGELLDACIRRIEERNPQLNAVIIPLFEKASAVVEGEGDIPAGPFRGVPFVLKDMTAHSAGDPYHEGMRFLKRLNWSEEGDNLLVERFRAAGFVIVGRTNVPELGLLPTTEPEAYGPTRNPWNLAHSAGGSSGGSAAAVAAGLVAAGHATDGGGSIRIPASACGLVGLKPTRGRVPTGPPAGDPAMDFNGDLAVTRSVRDTAAILDAVHGPAAGRAPAPGLAPPRRPYTAEIGSDPGQCRIGIRTDAFAALAGTHPDCVTATEVTGRLLQSLGHVVEPVDLPVLDDPSIVDHFVTVMAAGVPENLMFWSERTGHPIGPEDVEPLTWALAELSRSTPPAQVSAAIEALTALTSAVEAWWADGFDLMLTPTLAQPPPPLGHLCSRHGDPLDAYQRSAAFAGFTPIFNLTGQPAISLPLHWTTDDLPVGVQLVAAFGREDLLIRVASQLEQATPWHTRYVLAPQVASGPPARQLRDAR